MDWVKQDLILKADIQTVVTKTAEPSNSSLFMSEHCSQTRRCWGLLGRAKDRNISEQRQGAAGLQCSGLGLAAGPKMGC